MIYCLLKYEVNTIFRHSPHAGALRADPRKLTSSTVPMLVKDRFIDELEFLYDQKYLQYCDPKVPLHHLAITMAKLGICRMRFVAHHPRHHPNGANGISPEENDALFLNSVRLIEHYNIIRKTKFAQHLLSHLTPERSWMRSSTCSMNCADGRAN